MKANITKITKEEINKWVLEDELAMIFEDGSSVQKVIDFDPEYDEHRYQIWENWDQDKFIGGYNTMEPIYDFIYNKLSQGIAIVNRDNWDEMGLC